MIRWLYPLSVTLRERGLLQSHPQIERTTDDRLVVELNADGLVQSVRVTRERTSYIRLNNYCFFPALNMPPLVTPPEGFRQPVTGMDWMFAAAAEWSSSSKQTNEFCRRWLRSAKTVMERLGNHPDFPDGLRQLLELRLALENKPYQDCLRQLLRQLATAAQLDKEVATACYPIFGVKQTGRSAERVFVPNEGDEDAEDIKLLIDHPGCGIFLPDTWARVNQLMFAREASDKDNGFEDVCALSGKKGLCAVSYPFIKVPVFRQFQVYSLDADTPALHHYGRSQGYAFPVLREVAADLSSTVRFLWSPEAEGKTWGKVPGHRLKGSKVDYDVLLLWVEEDPSIGAAALGDCQRPGEKDEEYRDDFQQVTSNVLAEIDQRLRGRINEQIGAHIHYLIVRKVNFGIFRAAQHGTYSSARWAASIRDWQQGCQALTGVASKLSPRQCVWLLSHSWNWSGDCEPLGYAPTLVDIWPIYLETADSTDAVEKLLQQVMNTHRSLLPLVHRLQRWPDQFKGKPWKDIEADALKLRALLSLLLHKKGHTVDELNDSAAFNLGLLLLQVDGLRMRYGVVARKKELPDSLSAEVSRRMTIDPLSTFNGLMNRIAVYLSWAKTTNDELARMFLAKFNAAAAKCAAVLENKPLTPRQQAEFWLGFSYTTKSASAEAEGAK
jgi:hypothetical protein